VIFPNYPHPPKKPDPVDPIASSFTSDQNNYNLRNTKNNIQVPFTPCVRSDFNPLIASHIVRNKLPEPARRCHSFGLFKKTIKNSWLLRNYLIYFYICICVYLCICMYISLLFHRSLFYQLNYIINLVYSIY